MTSICMIQPGSKDGRTVEPVGVFCIGQNLYSMEKEYPELTSSKSESELQDLTESGESTGSVGSVKPPLESWATESQVDSNGVQGPRGQLH